MKGVYYKFLKSEKKTFEIGNSICFNYYINPFSNDRIFPCSGIPNCSQGR